MNVYIYTHTLHPAIYIYDETVFSTIDLVDVFVLCLTSHSRRARNR